MRCTQPMVVWSGSCLALNFPSHRTPVTYKSTRCFVIDKRFSFTSLMF
ncbi:hypothetical protein SNOG_01036 [Parastagonospora nodorum SN15]|uniref:Uncharacterized protein n=1 Tax=Phaeosphaeria nodorum (strain SN15 / ATCC MYA-4574 / FGSC 10173) TaxID=321614 RepID=Q0V4M8_PHANO|nr:hypothetical protein SNOG_01036 [Parastagonospora nodorum SN15]EAT92531.1 hypothetical protein SNOG_01036 [Parastagonospora nodorum SN15]